VTTYYRGREVLITDELFVAFTPYSRRFRLEELYDVKVVVGRPCRGIRRRRQELWATTDLGVGVLLFGSCDATTFGQVKRGLIRALEGMRDRMEQYGVSGYR
jgi:hypothetical protein